MTRKPLLTRRQFAALSSASLLLPNAARAADFREITWDDLVPPGLPFGEIIGDGELDLEADTWAPIWDENSYKLNMDLDGLLIHMPGFIIPIDIDANGVTSFVLAPYLGACIHTPPPPPNQLVFVTTEDPWRADSLWDAVVVYGKLHAQLHDTDIAETGYRITAEKIELYEWL